jgi:putative membrane protein
MRAVYTLALLLMVSSAASAESIGEKTGVNSMLGISPSTADFVSQAAVSDMFEVKSSELAAQRGDEPTKVFATQMIAAHTKTTEELKALVASGKVKETPPAQMDKSHLDKLSALAKLDGTKFTDQYQSDQVIAHKDAVSLFERYSQGGDNMDLKAWALKTLPELKHHLEMAQKLAE